jgi:hypothetical protein
LIVTGLFGIGKFWADAFRAPPNAQTNAPVTAAIRQLRVRKPIGRATATGPVQIASNIALPCSA